MNCFSDDYDGLQSHSDAVKAESQSLPTAAACESHVPVTSNLSEADNMPLDEKTSKVADNDSVLNLVKVKNSKESEEMEADSGMKEEEKEDEKCTVKLSELLKSESSDDVKKDPEKDDEDTLSESETTTGLKTDAVSGDAVKDDTAANLMQKGDVDEDIDHSAVPSPCPEVRC